MELVPCSLPLARQLPRSPHKASHLNTDIVQSHHHLCWIQEGPGLKVTSTSTIHCPKLIAARGPLVRPSLLLPFCSSELRLLPTFFQVLHSNGSPALSPYPGRSVTCRTPQGQPVTCSSTPEQSHTEPGTEIITACPITSQQFIAGTMGDLGGPSWPPLLPPLLPRDPPRPQLLGHFSKPSW